MPCPFCHAEVSSPVRFTAWGGVVGPFMLSLVKCSACGGHYNARNGRCVKKAVRLYTIATLFALMLLAAMAMYQLTGGRTTGVKGKSVTVANVYGVSELQVVARRYYA